MTHVQAPGDDFDALVLLPGALIEPSEELLRRLGASRRVIALTYPAATRMTDLTDAIAAQLGAAGIERAAVLGSSYGGWVAQCLARRHPELVSRLILVHTFALRPDAEKRFRLAAKIWKAVPGPLLRGLMMARVRRMLRPLQNASPGEHQRALAHVRELTWAPETAAALLRQNACLLDSITSFSMAPGDLAQLDGKILIIESDDDPAIRAPEREHLRSLYPGAEVRTFHGTGHITALVKPGEFVSTVNEFLGAAGSALASE
jgi:pimeloyl-ACP methyl ester carboxylesterase